MATSETLSEPLASSLVKPLRLGRGTSLSTDLELTRRFHEEYLGLECVRYSPEGMLTRDHGNQAGGRKAGGDYWVLDTRLTGNIDRPQCVWNHWGIDVATKEEVDRAHQVALERKAYFGLNEVQEIRNQHGSYSFYFSDVMGNWWEVQCSLRTPEQIAEARKAFL